MPDQESPPTNRTGALPERLEPPDWDAFYRHTAGRETRPLFKKGMAAIAAAGVKPGDAVEIGFGDGTETIALLMAGWHVTAIDPTPAAGTILREKAPPELLDRLDVVTSTAEDATLPEFDLLYAGYALPFIAPARFPAVWATIRERLRPGGFIVANVFGVHDSWAGDPDLTFLDRTQAAALAEGFEVLAFDEEDADGPSASGPKHWHLFDIVARKPGAAGQ
jgi:SAM-dependent methyltransferase